jgi:uncharacterized phiE125 gp8 family phage protein
MYGLTLVTGPTAEPVSLAEVKDHLRVSESDNDGMLASYLLAARSHVESICGLALMQQTWDLSLDRFPCSLRNPIIIPRSPAQSITSVQYVDANGSPQVWSSSNYALDTKSMPSRLLPVYGQPWPTAQIVANAVTVRFVAGFGSSMPEPIRHAILLLTAHFNENREPVNVGNIVTSIPMSADALLAPYRMNWFS